MRDSFGPVRAIFIVSDATGETAERMVRAATLQFTGVPVNVRTYARVRLETECEQLIGFRGLTEGLEWVRRFVTEASRQLPELQLA